MKEWIKVLNDKIKEFSFNFNPEEKEPESQQAMVEEKPLEAEKKDEILFEMDFRLKTFSFNIFETKKEKWLSLETSNFGFFYQKKDLEFNCQMKLQSLLIEDSTFKFTNKKFMRLISSIPEESSAGELIPLLQVIEINLNSKEAQHPDYRGVDLDLDVKCGYLIINWKPDTLLKIGEYVTMLRQSSQQRNFEREYEAILMSQGISTDMGAITSGNSFLF